MKSHLNYLVVAVVVTLGAGILAGSQGATAAEQKNDRVAAVSALGEEAEEEDEAGHGSSLWSYAGKIGPARWAKLSKDYRLCGVGASQSPCSEGVNWYGLRQPITVSMDQIKKFSDAVGANNRPIQPVNNRLVLAPTSGE